MDHPQILEFIFDGMIMAGLLFMVAAAIAGGHHLWLAISKRQRGKGWQ
jgi:hypothetical protein